MTDTPDPWAALRQTRERLSASSIEALFDQGADRAPAMTFQAGPLRVDLSRNALDRQAWQQLHALAAMRGVASGIEALFAGKPVNTTEGRPALHAALRHSGCAEAAGVAGAVADMHQSLYPLADRIRAGQWRGATGKPVTDLVNIGIGGSDLGPRLAVRALQSGKEPIRVHFLANIDGAASHEILGRLDPATTLFSVTSKSFGTRETLTNATTARHWLSQSLGRPSSELNAHFLAVTANVPRAVAFGIDESSVLPMWDWVGGRYSLWSAVGLPLAVAIGSEGFQRLLDGAAAMDEHFRASPLQSNVPVLLALLGIWHRNLCGMSSYAMVPYDQRLEYLPAWLQQLDMESNGKSVQLDGSTTPTDTGAICWGGVGTDGQHAYFQWLHQGTTPTPVDFVGVRTPDHPYANHHRQLLANMLGQATALMRGRSEQATRELLLADGRSAEEAARLAPHMTFPGNRPSTLIMLEKLDPESLGALLAMLEHRVYAQALIWDINAFDQWGVELGKTLSLEVEAALEQGHSPDPSLAHWVRWLGE